MPTTQKNPYAEFQQPAAAPAASDPYAEFQGANATDTTAPEPTMLEKIGHGAKDFAKGVGEGALSTISSADTWAAKHLPTFVTTPIGQAPTPENQERSLATTQDLATPANTLQRIGKGTEQAGEFLLPTGLEEAGAQLGGAALGRGGRIVGRLLGAGAHGGSINKVQGGDFDTGAAAGAGGTVIGAGLKKIAPVLAETALKVRGTDRAYGRTPGQAILSETKGITPRAIADQASSKVDTLSDELGTMARDSDSTASLQPAREAATKSIGAAYGRNNKSTYDKLIKMGHQLDTTLEGEEIPEITTPQQLLHLKRGIGDLQTSWNPATQPKWVNGQVGHVYHALDEELDRALPAGAELNRRISTLMPVAQRANAEDLNAGFTQRALGRVGAHTGALAGAGIGGAAGYKEGGLPGAAVGAGLGILVPEAIASPEFQLSAARALHSPGLRKIAIPAATGAGLQLTHRRMSPFEQ